eukprot:jgi/Botrbrau1/17389/Bobra.0709s0001.1
MRSISNMSCMCLKSRQSSRTVAGEARTYDLSACLQDTPLPITLYKVRGTNAHVFTRTTAHLFTSTTAHVVTNTIAHVIPSTIAHELP